MKMEMESSFWTNKLYVLVIYLEHFQSFFYNIPTSIFIYLYLLEILLFNDVMKAETLFGSRVKV